jgi:RNA polymerase sigma factor (sigma-70 family)
MTTNEPAADLLVLHGTFVRRLAAALAGDAADDVAQDAWVRALAAPPPRAGARRWLAAITGNVWKNRVRADARRERRERQRERVLAGGDPVPSVDEIVAREEVRQRVVEAVVRLPEPLRDVVLLRFYEGLDSAAIGARLQRPASTVRSQLSAALEQLRQRLDDCRGDARHRAWTAPLLAWRSALTAGNVALRAGWPLRAAGAAALLLVAGALVLPQLTREPPSPPPSAPPVATADDAQRSAPHQPEARTPVAATANVAVAPPDATRLRGRVVTGADDRPVPGAVVELQRCAADEMDPSIDPELARDVRVLATATPDADGRFAFDVRRAHVHRLHARAAGLAGTRFGCIGGSDVALRVDGVAAVSGTVLDAATRRPVAGALLRVTRPQTAPRGASVELAQAVTAEDGAFRFTQLPPVAISVRVSHQLLGARHQQVALQPGGEHHVELELAGGQTMTGRVTDAATGAPLPGAEVSDDAWFARRVLADADGRYQLQGCAAKAGALLLARADGYATAWLEQPATGQDGRRDVALRRAGTVRGRFVDEAGVGVGAVLAGAGSEFGISIGMATDWRRATVARDGRFTVGGLDPDGRYSLLVHGDDVGARVLVLPRSVGADAVLDVGDVVVRAAGELGGIVVDETGAPLVGAQLHLQGLDGRAWELAGRRIASLEVHQLATRARTTNDDGSFRFGGLAAGSYRLAVTMPGRGWRAEFGPYDVRDGEAHADVRVTIEQGRVIAGTLRLDSGLPLPQWESIRLLAENPAGRQAARVAADGSFRFERLDDGEHTIRAFRLPKGWQLPVRRVQPGTKDLVLTLVGAATVEGRVLGTDGTPRRARVICWHAGSGEDGRADADGRFRFEVPPDWTGQLTASDPEDESLQASVENVTAGARDLVLRLAPSTGR